MPPDPNVTAVCLLWNDGDEAVQFIPSLEKDFESGLRLVILDNGSIDGSLATVQSFLDGYRFASQITIFRNETNEGYTGGINLATYRALEADPAPDYIWLLSPDVTPAEGDLDELIGCAREARAGITHVREGGAGQAGLGPWPWPFFSPVHYMISAPPGARWVRTGRCAAWCAIFDARMLREMIARDGYFQDERIFLDWDEWDVSLRGVSLGWPTVAAMRVKAHHDWQPRSQGPNQIDAARQYYQSRNSLLVSKRFMPAWQFWLTVPLHFARDASWFARLRLQRAQPNERAYLEGVWDAIRGRNGKWAKHPDKP